MINSLQGTNKGNRYFWNIYGIDEKFYYLPIYYLLPDILMADTGSKKDKVPCWDTEPEINLLPHSFI